MARVKPKRHNIRVDMTAMTDVSFLLLTFFILTAQFAKPDVETITTVSYTHLDVYKRQTQGLSGVYGFLKKFYNLYFNGDNFEVSEEEPTKEEFKILHTLIKKVGNDIENFSFNTSVSQFMIAVNEFQKLKTNKRKILEPLAIVISCLLYTSRCV